MGTSSGENKDISRRRFIRTGAAGLGAAIVSGSLSRHVNAAAEEGEKKEPPAVAKRTLGRTGLEVSAIGFGTFGFSNPGVLQKAVESGINLVLTDRTYANGNAEKAIGEVLKKIDRKKVILGTGWGVAPGVTKAALLEMLDGSLKRLQTDYVDLMRAFMVNDPKVLEIDEQFEALEAAKKAGKVRFYGVSAHGGNLLEVFNAAVDSGKFDYVMGRYNFMEHEKGEAFIKKLAEKNIGFVGFKIRAGSRQEEVDELQEDGLSARAAAIKWALQNPNVTSILGMIRSFEAIEEHLKAAREKLTVKDERLLRLYAERFDSEYCRNCGTCQEYCPHGVAVADVMRYCMYFKYYHNEAEARRLYAKLHRQVRPVPCDTCPGYCVEHCPHRLQVRQNLLEANRLLA